MKKLILLLLFLLLCIKVTTAQTVVNINNNTTIAGGHNNKEYHISDNVTLTINGSLTNYSTGKFVLLGCNAKLDVIGSFTGNYTVIDIERYCGSCTSLTNFSYVGHTYDNDYLSTDGAINFTDVFCVEPLPVELISFTADETDSGNMLEWVTASEINTSTFVIEKSLDGINFEKIGSVMAVGNSFDENKYLFIDVNKAHVNYYRLKIIDFDGSFEYSEILVISNSNYPTPMGFELYKLNGQLVYKSSDTFNPYTTYPFSKGIYIVKIGYSYHKINLR